MTLQKWLCVGDAAFDDARLLLGPRLGRQRNGESEKRDENERKGSVHGERGKKSVTKKM